MSVCSSEVSFVHRFYRRECRDLSGETIGMCVAGIACSVSVSRLVGGLGLSGLLSALVSVSASSALEVAFRLTANRSETRNLFL